MSNNREEAIEKSRKLVVVGDGMCGKTSLLFAFKDKDDDFNSTHAPTIFDTYAREIKVDEKKITLALFDTAGEEDFDRLRPLSYPYTNVVLICFSAVSPTSATNVIIKWNPEIRHFCDSCPVILVACKIDLRKDPETIMKLTQLGEKPITTDVGRHMAAQINADAYMECSAKTREGVEELFSYAARLALQKRARHKSSHKCVLQ